VVCANLDLSSFELGQYVKPWCIVNKGGMKIGIIGLEADISTCVSKTVSSRIPQLDPVEETNKWAKYLREEEKCDMVILLSHQGYEPEDQENAAKIKGVDLVVGGHSHTFVDDFVYVKDAEGKSVPIITDGCWGLEAGVVKVY
jgi:5'-nucleotidase